MATEGPPAAGTIGLTFEGDGVVATCKVCGWLIWNAVRSIVETAAREHTKKHQKKGAGE